jgi:hypothetical protein
LQCQWICGSRQARSNGLPGSAASTFPLSWLNTGGVDDVFLAATCNCFFASR